MLTACYLAAAVTADTAAVLVCFSRRVLLQEDFVAGVVLLLGLYKLLTGHLLPDATALLTLVCLVNVMACQYNQIFHHSIPRVGICTSCSSSAFSLIPLREFLQYIVSSWFRAS